MDLVWDSFRRHKGGCSSPLHHQGAARLKRHSYFISPFGSTAAIEGKVVGLTEADSSPPPPPTPPHCASAPLIQSNTYSSVSMHPPPNPSKPLSAMLMLLIPKKTRVCLCNKN